MPRISSSIGEPGSTGEPVELAAQALELVRCGIRQRCRRRRSVRLAVPRPATERQQQEDSGDKDRDPGEEVAGEVEALPGRRHQGHLTVLLHELIEDLLRRLPLPREPEDVLVQRRTVRALEVGGPARVDVEAAAAAAAKLFLDRLYAGVGVERGDGLFRATSSLRIIDATRAHRVLDECASADSEKPSATQTIAHRSASSFTAYPAWTDEAFDPLTATAVPPGHSTIRPPITSTKPPNHTHQTSGLIVKRNTACSVPFTRPASTTYRSTRSPLMMPTSVEGSNVLLPKASTCWRFSVRRRPMSLPSRRTSRSAAVTCRLSALYCEMPRCVNVYTWPSLPLSSADSPGRSVASVSVLNAMPAKPTKSSTIAMCTM